MTKRDNVNRRAPGNTAAMISSMVSSISQLAKSHIRANGEKIIMTTPSQAILNSSLRTPRSVGKAHIHAQALYFQRVYKNDTQSDYLSRTPSAISQYNSTDSISLSAVAANLLHEHDYNPVNQDLFIMQDESDSPEPHTNTTLYDLVDWLSGHGSMVFRMYTPRQLHNVMGGFLTNIDINALGDVPKCRLRSTPQFVHRQLMQAEVNLRLMPALGVLEEQFAKLNDRMIYVPTMYKVIDRDSEGNPTIWLDQKRISDGLIRTNYGIQHCAEQIVQSGMSFMPYPELRQNKLYMYSACKLHSITETGIMHRILTCTDASYLDMFTPTATQAEYHTICKTREDYRQAIDEINIMKTVFFELVKPFRDHYWLLRTTSGSTPLQSTWDFCTAVQEEFGDLGTFIETGGFRLRPDHNAALVVAKLMTAANS